MRWVCDLPGLYDFIALVVLDAPDDFPVLDYRAAEDQLNLERAFAELREGLGFVEKRETEPELHDRLHSVLNAALSAYQSGNRVAGAHLLQDFQGAIFSANQDSHDSP